MRRAGLSASAELLISLWTRSHSKTRDLMSIMSTTLGDATVYTDSGVYRHTYIHTYIHTYRQTDRQTDRQIDGQTITYITCL